MPKQTKDTAVAIFHWWWEKRKEENTRRSSYAFKKRSATARLCNTTENQILILTLDKTKIIGATKTKRVSDDTYEDVMEGMKMILCSIYYCKMCKCFCLNEFLCFVCIGIYMLQNIGIFMLKALELIWKKVTHDLIHVFFSQTHLFEQILFTDALLNLSSKFKKFCFLL